MQRTVLSASLILCLSCSLVYSQIPGKVGFKLQAEHSFLANTSASLPSNTINDIVIHKNEIWLGTGKGLALSNDGGKTWTTYTRSDGLPRGGISAIAVSDTIIWVAAIFDSLVSADVCATCWGRA